VTRPTRALPAVLLALLAAQFLLGMITNLYAPIPPAVPGLHGNLDARARRGRPLGAPARPARAQDPRRRGPRHRCRRHFPGGALTPRPAATVAPIRPARPVHVGTRRPRRRAFLAYYQDDLYSLLMSIGFLGALFSYGTGPYLTR